MLHLAETSGKRQGSWVLADQVLVSGANFLVGIMLARFLGPGAFGVYVLLQALMFFLNSFQGALIIQPMLSAAPQLRGEQRVSYIQGVFALQISLALLMSLAILLLGMLGLLLGRFMPQLAYAGLAGPLALFALVMAILGFQLQDWQRRYYFVMENSRSALIQDLSNYAAQILLLLWAQRSGHLDVSSAFWILAASSMMAFTLQQVHSPLRPAFAQARVVMRDSWRNGRDYLIAWQFQWLAGQGVLLLGAGMAGAEAAGGVRAAQNIVGPMNLLFQAMDNLVPIVAARRYADGGIAGLSAYLGRITLWGSALLLPVLLFLSLWSEPLTHLLYGESYAAFSSLVAWHAATVFLQFHLRQVFFFLRTVRATGAILRAAILMALGSVLVAFLSVPIFHASGFLMALLSGTLLALLYAIEAMRQFVRNGIALPASAGVR